MIKKKAAIPVATVAYPAIVGKTIASRRARQGLNQSSLATALGITQSAYSRLEAGSAVMNVTQLWKVANALGCEPADILGEAAKLEQELRDGGTDVVAEAPDGATPAVIIGLALLAALMHSSR